MKLQAVTIIFSLIVVPIVLILGFYIQAQVDTISMQTSYDTKLLDATHDAMAALELNTANEELSSVADALRSIISASNNIFINALATNLGMSNASKSMIQPYIPAVLYTLYDGYYIYSPTKTPVVLTNNKGNAVTVGDPGTSIISANDEYTVYGYTEPKTNEIGEYVDDVGNPITESGITLSDKNAEDYGQVLYKIDDKVGTGYTTIVKEGFTEYKIDYVLKSFMPYSARYEGKANIDTNNDGTADIMDAPVDVVINYTLDNYMIINGTIGNVYYSKSGYFIKKDLVRKISINNDENEGKKLLKYNEEKIEEKIDNLLDAGNEIKVYINSTYENVETADQIVISSSNKNTKEADSIKYYIKSTIFSNWVYNNLSDIEEQNISKNAIENQTDMYKNLKNLEYNIIYNFEGSQEKLFNKEEDPEKEDSRFNIHKTAIIKNAIQYNLNVAMSAYNEMSSQAFSFNMPVISDSQWQQITSNVTIVAFMQGFNCGLKTYNNYAIVPSTNNEFTVIPSEIYYLSGTGKLDDENSTYHRIDCKEFEYPLKTTDTGGTTTEDYGFDFFKSKEVKYDKIYDKVESKYKYDHKNYACYKCIVNSNYLKNYYNGTEMVDTYSNKLDINSLEIPKQRLYYTAVGYERQNIYKSNAIVNSEGLEVFDIGNTLHTNTSDCTITNGSSRPINEIKQIKVIISNVKTANNTTPVAEFNLFMNGSEQIGENERVSIQNKEQTITVDVNSETTSKLNTLTIRKTYPENEDVKFFVKEIEIIYK